MTDYLFPEIDTQGNFISPLVKSHIQNLTYTRTGPGRPDQPSTTAGTITGSEPVGTVYNSTGGSGTVAGTWKKTSTGWISVDDSAALRAETAAKKAESAVASIDAEIQEAIAANPDLRGHDGVSITNVTAVDGVATVSFSDGTTRKINLPKGNDGRTPVITWSGTRLVVDGVQGPDLRGPTGPAPTVSWSGDKLVVGGQTGPSLIGPTSTVPGPAPSIRIGTVTSGAAPSATITGTSPDLTLSLVLQPGGKGDPGNPGAPGALANASSYVLVGPGRPDAPTTTGGVIPSPDTTPVGAEYRSTDGAGVGAWVWQKRPDSGWVVTSGDTGWRDVTGLFSQGRIVSGQIHMRRENNRVQIKTAAPWSGAQGYITVDKTNTTWTIPAGFTSSDEYVIVSGLSSLRDSATPQFAFVIWSYNRVSLPLSNLSTNLMSFTSPAVWNTSVQWPTAPLPGSPA